MTRRILPLAVLAVTLGGCGDPATVAEIEDCLRRKGAEVSRPAAPDRVRPLLPAGTRLATRAFWQDRGQALFFRAPDEATARQAQDRLRTGLAGSGVAGEDVKRDGPWVVLAEVTGQEAQDGFNCAR